MKQRRAFGCIQKVRKNVYRLRWTDGGRRKSETVYGSRLDAERRMGELHMSVDTSKKHVMTVADIWEKLARPEYERNTAPSTMYNIDKRWEKHIEPFFGKMYVDDVKASAVQEWLLNMPVNAAKKSIAIMRSIMRHAVILDMIPSSPVDIAFEMPKTLTKEYTKDIIHVEEIGLYYMAVADTFVEAPFILGACAGLRPGEMLGVKVGEVEYVDNYAVVEVLREVDNTGHIRVNTDGSERVKTDMSNRYAVIYEPYASRLMELQDIARDNGHTYLADDGGGMPISINTLRKYWYELVAEKGLKRIPLRNLRPTFATSMHNYGMRTEDIARLMGHSKPIITFATYQRPNKEDILKTYQSVMNN